jgi:hypothetical protein
MAKSKVNKVIEELDVLDTPIVEEQPMVVELPILKGDQTIIGLGLGGLVKDKEYKVSSDIATILITKGFASLKNK